MKRLLVLLSLAAAFALAACQNQGSQERRQQGSQPGSETEPGSDVRSAYPGDEDSGAATDEDNPMDRGATDSPSGDSGSIGSPNYPSPSDQQNRPNQPGSMDDGSRMNPSSPGSGMGGSSR